MAVDKFSHFAPAPEDDCGTIDGKAPDSPERRSFLGALLALGTAGVGALLSIPLMRFSMHPLLTDTTETTWSEIGKIDDFTTVSAPVKKLITVEQRDGWRKIISEKAIYVIRDGNGELAVLSAICTHLGCSIPWNEKENKFVCPCHKGVFDPAGKLLAGPPPRNMDRLESKTENGTLLVRYQYFRQLIPNKEVMA